MPIKRIIIAVVTALLMAVIGYAVFVKTHPRCKLECEIRWLSNKLSLSEEQTEKVRALHRQYCPKWNGLAAKMKTCTDPVQLEELKRQSDESMKGLVDNMCLVLSPPQKEQYLQLVESWKHPQPKPPDKP